MTPHRPKRVLLLYGGRSAEHEISILSARFVLEALDTARYQPLLVAIDQQGRWWLQQAEQLGRFADAGQAHVDACGSPVSLPPVPRPGPGAGALRVQGADDEPFDVVFPVLHGPYGEDGCIQGLLELAAVPYVGAGVTASAVGMDKIVQKRLWLQAGLPVLPYRALTAVRFAAERTSCLAGCAELGFPLFVKPANMGSSLGIRRAAGPNELGAAIEHALSFDTRVLIEQGLQAPREIELAVLGNEEPRVSLPGEIAVQHSDGYYSYDAKYLDPDGATLKVPANLRDDQAAAVQLLALRAYRSLGCAGMARVDLFIDQDDKAYLNELNTIPGFTAISMYPRLWRHSGVSPRELIHQLIELGLQRHRQRACLRTSR